MPITASVSLYFLDLKAINELIVSLPQPWPVVEDFLNSLEQGSLGADIGCGNGKYIGVNPNVCILGSDRYFNLEH